MKTTKTDCAKEPFTFDWTDFYDTFPDIDPINDPITNSAWTLTGSGTATTGSQNVASPLTSIFVIGGVVGETLVLENTIEIGGGTYKDCRKLFISVV